jgi:hypothetical protein
MITRRGLGRSLAASALLFGVAGAPLRALAQSDEPPPNVFISPAGKPFRAALHEPYPVVVWFKQADKNGDGKLDHAEFVADAEAFFKELDVNGDGVLDNREVQHYERGIAPEIIGYRYQSSSIKGLYGGHIWRAQRSDGPMDIVPGGYEPADPRPAHDIDESMQGAAPYGFFAEPEPVMAADENLNGRIKKAAFLRLADRHFDRLDPDGVGYLTLDKLPKTEMQKRVQRAQKRGAHS